MFVEDDENFIAEGLRENKVCIAEKGSLRGYARLIRDFRRYIEYV